MANKLKHIAIHPIGTLFNLSQRLREINIDKKENIPLEIFLKIESSCQMLHIIIVNSKFERQKSSIGLFFE